MNSLRARLGLGLSLALLVLLGGQWLAVHYGAQQLLQRQAAARLEHDLEALLSGLRFTADGAAEVDDRQLIPPYHRPLSGHYYQLRVDGRLLRSRSLWDGRLEFPEPALGAVYTGLLEGPQGQPLLLLARGFRKEGRAVVIAAAEDLTATRAEAHRLQVALALLAAGIVAVLLALQWWLLSRGLAPLHALRREVRRLRRGEIGTLAGEPPAEVRPLVAEINQLLDFMERRLQRSRHALGDLSHALKTPLSRLFQLSEEPALPVETAAELRRQAERIRELAERELKRARLAGGGHGRRIELAAELEPLAELFRRMHREAGIAVETAIPAGLTAPIDREDLLEMVGNLLDNGCKWAAGRVRLSAAGDEALTLTVEDDGPGCPPQRLEEIVRRGGRLDEGKPGHGLGLAIVAALVAEYGGELACDVSPLGGLRVSLRLPGEGLS